MKSELQKQYIPDDETSRDIENRTSRIVGLKDGRNLGYAEYGSRGGDVVFYFHGSPSSRFEAAVVNETAIRLNLRVISIDRPGMGLSTFKNGRRILDFVDDISELADILQIDRFAVMAMSGGGPYVCACTFKIPRRLTGASIISGIGPIDGSGVMKDMLGSVRTSLWLCRRAPWLMRVLFTAVAYRVCQKRDLFFWKSVPYVDQTTLSLPFVSDIWVESITEAFHFGTAGSVLDLGLLDRPWGFDPAEINFPVQIWHGEMDRNVPLVIARRLADRIPNCRTNFITDEGHFSLWLNYIEDIMKSLISQSIRAPLKR